MQPVSDNDLILFHFRDGLDAVRMAEIEAALSASDRLRARQDRLRRLFEGVDAEVPEPSANFEQRLWARLDQRMAKLSPAPRSKPGLAARLRDFLHSGIPFRLAWVGSLAALMIAVGVGYFAGRSSVPEPIAMVPSSAPTMASRMLDSYVAGHLRATEGLLLTAVNDEGGGLLKDNRELASGLVESNRLYAVAAARAGNTRLADFLRQLEPVLIEVANQPGGSSVEDTQGLRNFLRDTDLLFQVRATESRIDAESKRSL